MQKWFNEKLIHAKLERCDKRLPPPFREKMTYRPPPKTMKKQGFHEKSKVDRSKPHQNMNLHAHLIVFFFCLFRRGAFYASLDTTNTRNVFSRFLVFAQRSRDTESIRKVELRILEVNLGQNWLEKVASSNSPNWDMRKVLGFTNATLQKQKPEQN